jgi:membrane associated rhomboid family serine protease
MNPGRFLRALLSFPPTWMVLLVTAVAEWSFFSWFQPSFIMAVSAAAVGAVLLLLWLIVVRSDILERLLRHAQPADATAGIARRSRR